MKNHYIEGTKVKKCSAITHENRNATLETVFVEENSEIKV